MLGRYFSIISAALLAIVSPHLYGRVNILLKAHGNRPSQLVHRQLPATWKLELKGQVKNCEDFHIDDDSGLAILSCDFSRNTWNAAMGFLRNHEKTDGGLFLWDFAKRQSDEGFLAPVQLLNYKLAGTDFHPLGIGYDAPSKTLFVANHAKAGNRLEVFQLDVAARTATHVRTVLDAQLPEPNSILPISGTELYVTNSHYFTARQNGVLSKLETYLGLPISAVVHIDLSPASGPKLTPVTRQAFCNGIARLNSTHVAVASTTDGHVRVYNAITPTQWNETVRIAVDMFPDNLSVDGDGTLYIAGHPSAMALEQVASSRLECDPPNPETAKKCSQLSAPSWVVSWTEVAGVKDVYVGDAIWASCTAAKDVKANIGLVAGLYGHGILTWRE